MLAATEVKIVINGSEKKKGTGTHTTFAPQNALLGSFWKFHVVVVQNNDKEMYKKRNCAAPGKVVFFLSRPTDFILAVLVAVSA